MKAFTPRVELRWVRFKIATCLEMYIDWYCGKVDPRGFVTKRLFILGFLACVFVSGLCIV